MNISNNIIKNTYTPYITFKRKEWISFQDNILNILSKKDMINLQKINNYLSIKEITEIYLPLSKLLNTIICSNIKKQNILKNFFKTNITNIPYIISISGSVAAGKSSTAKILQILLRKWPENRIIEIVTTDGFLYSNRILKKKNLIKQKGFPQSYDIKNFIQFIKKIKLGIYPIQTPVHSHIIYDILYNTKQITHKPDILILEGLNILQTLNFYNFTFPKIFISDFIDFSIYIDAPEYLLQKWYIHRFLKFFHITFSNPNSYFHRYSQLSTAQLISIASQTWITINAINLNNNILPTRETANLILRKGKNHIINSIQLKIQ